MRYSSNGGFFELNPFPGCNQLVISNHTFIPKELRGNKLGICQHRERLQVIKDLGYDAVICTVAENNVIEQKILNRFGWEYLTYFNNRETERKINLFLKKIER